MGVRVKFKGIWKRSPTDGVSTEKTSDSRLAFREIAAKALSSFCMLLMLSFLIGLLYLKVKYGISDLVFSVINAAQVQFFRIVWKRAAVWLTNFENHRTSSSYNTAYAMRIFGFTFMNTMLTLFYIAYMKIFVQGCEDTEDFARYFQKGGYDACAPELAVTLVLLWITDLGLELFTMIVPGPAALVKRMMRRTSLEHGSYHPLGITGPGFVEMQRHLPKWDFDDQAMQRVRNIIDLAIVVFFSNACPEYVALFTIGTLIRMRTLGRRLVHNVRRIYPTGSDGLGGWYTILCGVFLSGAFCNIFFTISHSAQLPVDKDMFLGLKQYFTNAPPLDTPRGLDWKSTLALSFALEHCFILPVALLVMAGVPGESKATAIHRARSAHVRWLYTKILQDTHEKGELEEIRNHIPKDRLFYLKSDMHSAKVWENFGQNDAAIARFMRTYEEQVNGRQVIASASPADAPPPPVPSNVAGSSGHDYEDRLFVAYQPLTE